MLGPDQLTASIIGKLLNRFAIDRRFPFDPEQAVGEKEKEEEVGERGSHRTIDSIRLGNAI